VKLLRRAAKWSPWGEAEVVDGSIAGRLARTYIEHSDVQGYLEKVANRHAISASCDVGSGYGRMLPVLREVSERVVAFEREPSLAELARQLYPESEVKQVSSLERLPVPDSTFDFVLSFTVLQHMSHDSVRRVASEIVRVLKPTGSLLLCEETDATLVYGQPDEPDGKFTLGRSVSDYEGTFAPLKLVETSPRRVEPGYPRPDVGSYLLFSAV
jgi:SAM-dependent methyltransferase